MQKSKSIWILLRSPLVSLPPIMTIIECLLDSKNYKINLISTKPSNIRHSNFCEYVLPQNHNVNRIKKIKNYFQFREFTINTLKRHLNKGDLIWLGSLDTALACKGASFLKTNPYILHLHELYDTYPRKLQAVKEMAHKAKHVVVPESNRAGILEVWLKLNKRPYILPNKPYKHPRRKYIKPTTEQTRNILKNYDPMKKIIIYQGHIEKDRNLAPIVKAIEKIENTEFWLMGIDHGYVKTLLEMSSKVKFLGYIPAPHHLEITSYADIGIMSYDLINLNHLYCAPNKIWEYLGFDIFFICNKVGSLDYFEQVGCCKLIDYNDINSITLAIEEEIIRDRDYSHIYDSINMKYLINSLVV